MKPFDLAPNEWWKAPTWLGSQIADVYAPTQTGGGTQTNIVDAWCAACFDQRRGDIIITNGGHTDYGGNEGYAFSVNPYSRFFLKWRIKWMWTPLVNGSVIENYAVSQSSDAADATPSAAHTYCGLNYCPITDTIFREAGSYVWGSTGGNTLEQWELKALIENPVDTAAGYWRRKADMPTTSNGGPVAKYDPVTKLIWDWTDNNSQGNITYDPVANVWNQLYTFAANPIGQEGNRSVALQPGKYWVVVGGTGTTQALDMVATLGGTETWLFVGGTTGATAIEAVAGPGLVWDGNSIVSWGGTLAGGTDNRDLYYLNLSTKAWTLVAGTGEIPTSPATNGTFSRFIHLGGGLCALFNSTTSDMYFVRTSWSDTDAFGGDGEPYYMPFLRGNTSRFDNVEYGRVQGMSGPTGKTIGDSFR